VAGFVDPEVQILDLSNNYWGTTDTGLIDDWIWDGNDDPEVHAFVDYEPFAGQPIPTEQRTWGEVKNLYR